MNKISIRFYKDHKVRAVWDDEQSLWWFSALDIVGAINQQDDHEKNRNYWKYLKAKLRKEQSEVVSDTTQLKLTAPDGKKRMTDVISQSGVDKLAKTIRNQQAMDFLDWFIYSDNTIDGQSRKKAYTLWEGNGRSTRIWLDMIFKKRMKMCVDWSRIVKRDYLDAMIASHTDSSRI